MLHHFLVTNFCNLFRMWKPEKEILLISLCECEKQPLIFLEIYLSQHYKNQILSLIDKISSKMFQMH